MRKIIFAFLIPVMGVLAADPGGGKERSHRASQRAGLILENVDQVAISLYPGLALHGKDLDRIGLSTKENPIRGLQEKVPNEFLLDEKEMGTFVEALADAGVLDGATHYDPSLKIVRDPFIPGGYAIRISNLAGSWVMELDLGIDLNTIKTLETLRKGLNGKAGKAMDQLLEKLNKFLLDPEAEKDSKL